MSNLSNLPYWRLSGFYFFYFAALGCFMPYWALYLESLGYNHAQMGLLMAVMPATKIISPNLWGWLADHTDRSVLLIRISSCLTAASFALVFWQASYVWLAVTMLLFGFFWNAPMALFEAITLNWLNQDAHRYTRIRIWGSVGFVSSVFATGWALNRVLALECLPSLVLAQFIGMGLLALLLPSRAGQTAGDVVKGSLKAVFRRQGVLAFFLACLLIQLAHGPYYTFFSIYLKEHGYDAETTGLLWSLGILAEMVLFGLCGGLFRRFSVRSVLLVSIGLSVLRWWLIAWSVDNLAGLMLAQSLHAASFGANHVAAMQFIHKHFVWPHQSKGQALYGSLSFGLGGMLGSYASGEVWDSLGPVVVFSAAALACLLAWVIVWVKVERISP